MPDWGVTGRAKLAEGIGRSLSGFIPPDCNTCPELDKETGDCSGDCPPPQSGVPEYRIIKAIEAICETIKSRAARGLPTYWEHIGLFVVVDCAAREYRKLRTKELMTAPAYRKIVYRRSVEINALR